MATHRKAGKPKGDYEVGYGRPPPERRFKKGQSGNLRGRPKGTKSLARVFKDALKRHVTVREDGKPRRMRMQDVIIQGIVNDAARRDPRAVRLLFALVDRYQDSSESQIEATDVSTEDRAIIEHFFNSRQSSGTAEVSSSTKGKRQRKRLSDT